MSNNNESNFEVDFTDSKTSKLEVGLRLAQVITLGVFLIWAGLVVASVIDIAIIDSDKATDLVNVVTPIILTTVTISIVAWLLGKDKLG